MVIALVLSTSAFALDGERYEEMVEFIESRVENTEERTAFIEAVEEYIEARDETLLAMVELVKREDAGPYLSAWQSLVSELSRIPELADVDDDLTSDEALDLYEGFMDEEQEWVSALSTLGSAGYRDQLVQLRTRLSDMTVELDNTWNTVLNADGQLDEREMRVMADIYGILADLARNSDGRRQTVRNSIQIVTDLLTRVDVVSGMVPGDVATAINQALEMIAESTKQYNDYMTAVEALRPQVRELAGQELGLLIEFRETRAATQEFVDDHGYDVMKALYDEAEEELEDFEGVGTSGQREDAGVFVDLLIDALEDRLAAGGDIFNAFVAKHNLKFFGPVSPDISEFLIETKAWLAETDRVSGLDLERVLTAWRSDANTFFGVSLSGDGITDYEREFIAAQLRDDLVDLQAAIDKAGQAFSTQNLALIRDRRDIDEALE
jgi:hypothetical protein